MFFPLFSIIFFILFHCTVVIVLFIYLFLNQTHNTIYRGILQKRQCPHTEIPLLQLQLVRAIFISYHFISIIILLLLSITVINSLYTLYKVNNFFIF